MSPPSLHSYFAHDEHDARRGGLSNVVVVDPDFSGYKSLAASARLGHLNLHLRSSAADALKLARRHRVDAWLIAPDLDDMSGQDLVELLRKQMDEAKVALVHDGKGGPGSLNAATRQAGELGAPVLQSPITIDDLEELLGIGAPRRPVLLPSQAAAASGSFVTLPVSISAAVIAIAVLVMS